MPITIAGTGQTLDQSLNSVNSEFMVLLDDKGIVKNCATKYTLPAHSGAQKNILNYRRGVASQLQQGVDLAQAQALQDDITSISATEAGIQIIIDGRTIRRVADTDLTGNAAKVAANAYDLLEDQVGILALASFTGSAALGGAGTVMSPGLQAAITARLRVGDNRTNPEPAPTPWNTILHPYSVLPLWGRMVPLSSVPQGTAAYGANTGAHGGVTATVGNDRDENTDSLIKAGIGAVGMLAGGMIKQDANFTVDSNDDYTGAGFSQEALLYLSEVEAHMARQTDDASMREAVELNFWGVYGYSVYRPANYGIPITLDASTPTS